jgi:hypothetical protein
MSISIAMAAEPMPATSAAAVHLDRQQFQRVDMHAYGQVDASPPQVGVHQASCPPRAQGWAGTNKLPASGLLVPRRDCKPLKVDSFRMRCWNLRSKLFGKGFNKTFHDFRETTSTELSDAGCTENEIACGLGDPRRGADE